jgi:hypothetical protein
LTGFKSGRPGRGQLDIMEMIDAVLQQQGRWEQME